MPIYLGLGSNQGDRRGHLAHALGQIAAQGVSILRVSPIVESPALLPDDALPEWNRPFLNLVAECSFTGEPEGLLGLLKNTEMRLGRVDARRWSPRPIDIDILLWNNRSVSSRDLRIPHPALGERAFFLSPLAALTPELCLPGAEGEPILRLARGLTEHIPFWMGIVNLTPDSFSDGGEFVAWPAIEAHIDRMWEAGVHMIDFGAESTRPGATTLDWTEELRRLEPILERALDKYSGHVLRPLISVDTYHVEVAKRAIGLGVDIINDVSGLTSPEMLSVAGASRVDWVAMHHVSIPAEGGKTLPAGTNAVDQVRAWLEARLEAWSRAGMETRRIIFDPGIGFGKNQLQSLALLRHIDRFHEYGLRLLVGHSRKSFLHGFSGGDNRHRDLTTIGASLRLCASHVDILRVHNVPDHIAAHRGWSHLVSPA